MVYGFYVFEFINWQNEMRIHWYSEWDKTGVRLGPPARFYVTGDELSVSVTS
jgi:hypothetical protein